MRLDVQSEEEKKTIESALNLLHILLHILCIVENSSIPASLGLLRPCSLLSVSWQYSEGEVDGRAVQG